MKIYVGNLSFETTESEIRELFGQYGEVEEVNLIADRETGRPRGFGFIEIRNDQAARDAIGALDGTEFGSRQIKVNEAKPRTDRGGGGGQRRSWYTLNRKCERRPGRRMVAGFLLARPRRAPDSLADGNEANPQPYP